MSTNGPPPVTTRPGEPPSGTSGAAPGREMNKNNSAKVAMELTKMLGQELVAAGKAILNGDARAFALSQTKLRQIQQAAVSIGGQQPAQPQGARTGVPNPVGRPIDPITRQGY